MIADGIQETIEKLLWRDKLSERSLPARTAIVALRYLYAVARDAVSGQLTMRAMSLVYTTLLSVIPLLAFSFSVLKGFGVHRQLEQQLYGVLAPLGQRGREITGDLIEVVDNVNGGVLGGVSLAFFVYTAFSMVQKVEESFNYVWFVTKPRSLGRRFSEYMVVLLVGPVVIVIALGMIASLRSTTVVQWMLTNDALGPLFVLGGKLAPYLLVIGVFMFMYMFMPNTRVQFRSALLGGVIAGFLWATISTMFTTFIAGSANRQAIYAGFTVPIATLIWLYLNWLVLLIGAQFAYYHQNPAYLRIGRREPRLSNAMRERLSLNIMFLVARAFRSSDRNMTLDVLSQRLRIPTVTLSPVASALEDEGLLRTADDEGLVPGREVSRVRLSDILDVVRTSGETGSLRTPRWSGDIDELGSKLDEAVLGCVGERTLADLLDAAESSKGD